MSSSLWLDLFLDSRAENHQIFALVFRKVKTLLNHSGINWPLYDVQNEHFNLFNIYQLTRSYQHTFVKWLNWDQKSTQPYKQVRSMFLGQNCGPTNPRWDLCRSKRDQQWEEREQHSSGFHDGSKAIPRLPK